jgi:3-hydroxyisobutyrate dehydrogenase-like beta-hydroxyacid dehydrogenase
MDESVCSLAVPSPISAFDGPQKVGLIGVGKMGLPIARHFHAGGHRVIVFDALPDRTALARAAGLSVGETLAAVLENADVVFSSLPHDGAFEAVAGEVAARARPGQLYVDTSTVSLGASQRVAHAFEAAQVQYLRVAVSGNPQMVENAQLTSISSGPHAEYQRVRALLKLLGPAQFYVGSGDETRVMKLVINLMVANTAGMLAEALALGQKGGLDWGDMWQVICASAVGSPVVKAKADQLKHYDFTPTFTVEQMQKDVSLILEAGAALRVPLLLTGVVAQSLQSAVATGAAGEDYAALIKVAQQSAGLPLHA